MNNEGVNGDKRMYRTATTTLGISNVYFVISRIRTHLTIELSVLYVFRDLEVCLKLHLKVVMAVFCAFRSKDK